MDVARLGDVEQAGGHGLLVRGIDDGDQVVLTLGPVGAEDLEPPLLVLAADFRGSLDGVLDGLQPLTRETVENDVRGHG